MRPDSLVFGCLLAIINKAIPRPIPEKLIQITRYFAYAGWITLITFAFMGNRTPFFALFTGVPFQIAILMIGPVALDMYWRPKGWINRSLSIKPLQYMGIRSYGVYIWHAIVLLPFLTAINDSTGMKRLVLGAIAAGLGYAAGPVSYKYLETRFLKIRERRMGPKPDRAEPPVVIAPQEPGEPVVSIASPATVAATGSNGSNGPPEPEFVTNQSSIDAGPPGPSSTTQDEG
jgi:peptidoglycan/LPS O-acetylase OafA/YrhL